MKKNKKNKTRSGRNNADKKCIVITSQQFQESIMQPGQKVLVGGMIVGVSLFSSRVVAVEIDNNTPVEKLIEYSKSWDSNDRVKVAGNPNTPPDVLTVLSKDFDRRVILRVAQNKNTTLKTLEVLFNRGKVFNDNELFHFIVKNSNTTPNMLNYIAHATTPYWESTRTWIAIHPNVLPETLTFLATDEEEYRVKVLVAKNPRTPAQTLTKLAQDSTYYSHTTLRQAIIANPNTPPEAKKIAEANEEAAERAKYSPSNSESSRSRCIGCTKTCTSCLSCIYGCTGVISHGGTCKYNTGYR